MKLSRPPIRQLLSKSTLLRAWGNYLVGQLSIKGKVLDLGGTREAPYLPATAQVTTLNLRDADIVHDLEQPLPKALNGQRFDHVTAFWLLEHVSRPGRIVREGYLLLNPGGSMIILVPFIHKVHPSPKDFGRYTVDWWRLHTPRDSRFEYTIAGSGVFSAVYQHISLLFGPLDLLFRTLAISLDRILCRWSKWNKNFGPEIYPLGYCIRYSKPGGKD